MIVYIAAPYTLGDVGKNLNRVFEVADQIASLGHTPYIPHLNHLWHIVSPKTQQFWLNYDLKFLDFCDALLRLDGESEGADEEVRQAIEWGLPVYHSVEAISEI